MSHLPPSAEPPRDSLLPAAENQRMFDAIARRYDLLNAVLSLGLDHRWRRQTVRALAPCPNGRYLDIGTGTGDLATEVCRAAPGATVVGVDPAVHMLRIAAKKTALAELAGRCLLLAGNAQSLPFASGTFDGVVSAFCIRNLEHRSPAFADVHRVLKPSGKAVFLDLTRPTSRVLRAGHRLYCRAVVPLVGRLLSKGEAYRYLIASIEHFPDVQTVLAEMRAAGFRQVDAVRLNGGIVSLFLGTRD